MSVIDLRDLIANLLRLADPAGPNHARLQRCATTVSAGMPLPAEDRALLQQLVAIRDGVCLYLVDGARGARCTLTDGLCPHAAAPRACPSYLRDDRPAPGGNPLEPLLRRCR